MTQAVLYVEIDVDFCSLTYGTSPCAAVVGTQEEIDAETATGLIKCFNTLKTCQDRANFDNAPVTLRFCKPADYLDHSIEAIPSVKGFSFTPARISLGENMGQRASLKVQFNDHPHDDTGGKYDKYLSERPYNPYEQGTFWGKFRARQPFLRGRTMRLIQGTADQALEEMKARTFSIETFEGPGRNGTFTLIAKDDLKRADSDRTVVPAASTGNLSAGISSSATSASLSPSGIGDSEYPASGYVAIGGQEVVSFTRSGDALTITRGQYNTDAMAHEAGDRLQLCKEYLAQDPADVIADLLENWADVDSAHIPIDAWRDETALYYGRVVSALIAEPTPVKTLISELVAQCGLAIWWDDLTPQVRLQVVRSIATDAEVFSALPGGNILAGSFQDPKQSGRRVTQVETYFGMINPLDGVSDTSNYRSADVPLDTDAEANNGKSRERIYSRWIPFGGNIIAQRVSAIRLARYREEPRQFKFDVYRHDASASPVMGEGCLIEFAEGQRDTGETVQVPAQILRVTPGLEKWTIEAEELNADVDQVDPNDRPITIGSDFNDVDLTVMHAEIYGAPLAGSTVTLTIDDSAIVGSTGTSTPALNIGSTSYWPTEAATGDTNSGSAVISSLNVDATTLFAVGQFVTGTGIADGSRIASIDSASQITLDTNTTATNTGAALTVYTVLIVLDVNGKIRGRGGKGGTGKGGDNNTGGTGSKGGPALETRYPILLNLAGDIKSGGGGGGGGGGDQIGIWGPQVDGGGGGGGAGREGGSGGSGPGGSGSSGSLDSGGSGKSVPYGWRGGNGGSPGNNGGSATGLFAGSGGNKGNAVDGWSDVTEGTVTGVYAGSKVN